MRPICGPHIIIRFNDADFGVVAVVQESLREEHVVAPQLHNWQVQDDTALGTSLVAAPGLQNQIGANNCFLNSIIQCLWRCRDFRDRLLALPAAVVQGALLSPPLQHSASSDTMHGVQPTVSSTGHTFSSRGVTLYLY